MDTAQFSEPSPGTETQETTVDPNAATQEGAGGEDQLTPEQTKQLLSGLYQQNESYKTELENLRSESGGNSKVMEQMRAIFAPPGEVDPNKQWEDSDKGFLDQVLEESLEAEKRGQPIPLTTQIAARQAQSNQQIRELVNQVKALSKTNERLTDPSTEYNNQTYRNFDMLNQKMVAEIYGGHNQGIYDAVTQNMVKAVKNIQSTKPEVWSQLQRDPAKQQQFVSHFVMQNVPNKAREVMANEKMMSEEMPLQELLKAKQEAREIKDPALRQRTIDDIRAKIWENTYMNNSRGLPNR